MVLTPYSQGMKNASSTDAQEATGPATSDVNSTTYEQSPDELDWLRRVVGLLPTPATWESFAARPHDPITRGLLALYHDGHSPEEAAAQVRIMKPADVFRR